LTLGRDQKIGKGMVLDDIGQWDLEFPQPESQPFIPSEAGVNMSKVTSGAEFVPK
jgi:hypothetical protein